jgi:ribosomal protein S18 acetylase RimI-like enzyme
LQAAAAHAKLKISRIYLHVQVSNHDGKRFYERHSFKESKIEESYYKKISPSGAWVLERDINAQESEQN